MKTKKEAELPKWFTNHRLSPTIYTQGAEVENPFSGACYTLTAKELSLYDYIIGLQFVIDRHGGVFNPKTREYQKDMARGLSWFRTHNAEAYIVLLD